MSGLLGVHPILADLDTGVLHPHMVVTHLSCVWIYGYDAGVGGDVDGA